MKNDHQALWSCLVLAEFYEPVEDLVGNGQEMNISVWRGARHQNLHLGEDS